MPVSGSGDNTKQLQPAYTGRHDGA